MALHILAWVIEEARAEQLKMEQQEPEGSQERISSVKDGIASYGLAPGQDGRPGLRRGKSILAREEGMAAHESGLNFLKRGATMRRNNKKGNGGSKEQYPGGGNAGEELLKSRSNAAAQAAKDKQDGEKAPLTPWMLYCYAITCCLPGVFLKSLGG